MAFITNRTPSSLRLLSQFSRLTPDGEKMASKVRLLWNGRRRTSSLKPHNDFSLIPANSCRQQRQQRSIFSFLTPAIKGESVNEHLDDKSGNQEQITMPTRQRQDEQHHNPSERNLHEAEIQDLLDSPVGSFRPSTWLQAQRLIQYLCEKQEDIPRSFQVLDRLVQEPDCRARLTNDMVYLVVKQWLDLYIKQQMQFGNTKNKFHPNLRRSRSVASEEAYKTSPRVFPPLTVWRKIDAYLRAGIPLEAFTCHKIIEGTAHAKCTDARSPHGPLLAETILDRMMSQSLHENPLLRPSTNTFLAVLMSWEAAASHSLITATREAAGQSALAILGRLKALYETNWGPEFLPNKDVYRRVMNIFARNGDGDQVEALLEELYSMYLDHLEDETEQQKRPFHRQHIERSLLPTAPFFSLALYAWSKSRDPMAAERAEAILDRILELEASGEIPNLKVTASFFNIVMVNYSRRWSVEAAIKVESIYYRLLDLQNLEEDSTFSQKICDNPKRPTAGTYLALITTWRRFDPAKAENYFWKWKEEYEKGNCEMRVDGDLLQTMVSGWYNTSSTVTDSAERIDRLIKFVTQIDTQLDSGSAPVEPTVAVFNMAISAWCRKNTEEGVQRAEELLEQMKANKKVHAESDSGCTVLSYLPIIQSLATLGRVERAEELLNEYFNQKHSLSDETDIDRLGDGCSDSTDVESIKVKHLHTRIVNVVLKGWLSKAQVHPEAAMRAEDLLLSMEVFGSRPNAASFQYVLDAWRRSLKRFNIEYYQRRHQRLPRIDQVVMRLDQERKRGHLGGNEEWYLTLRQGWSLLSVQP